MANSFELLKVHDHDMSVDLLISPFFFDMAFLATSFYDTNKAFSSVTAVDGKH